MENTSEKKTKLKALNPIVLLAIILVIAAIATYIVPAGVYERVMDPTTQREVVNPQSFHWTMDLLLPWPRLAALCASVVVAGTLTALVAGRTAVGRDAVLAVKEDW